MVRTDSAGEYLRWVGKIATTACLILLVPIVSSLPGEGEDIFLSSAPSTPRRPASAGSGGSPVMMGRGDDLSPTVPFVALHDEEGQGDSRDSEGFLLERSASASAQPGRWYTTLIFSGMCCGLVGDTILLYDIFTAGLGAFLVGHLLYIAAFWGGGVALRPWRAGVGIVLGVVSMVLVFPGTHMWQLQVLMGFYELVEATSIWRALARIGHATPAAGPENRRSQWFAGIGAAVFLVSDSVLAYNKFVHPAWLDSISSGFAVMLTYWIAQLGIALSVNRAVPRRTASALMDS